MNTCEIEISNSCPLQTLYLLINWSKYVAYPMNLSNKTNEQT